MEIICENTIGWGKTEYIKTKKDKYYIRITRYYDTGKYTECERGFYVNVYLTKRNYEVPSLSEDLIGDGYKVLLLPVTRKSKSKEIEAEKNAAEAIRALLKHLKENVDSRYSDIIPTEYV